MIPYPVQHLALTMTLTLLKVCLSLLSPLRCLLEAHLLVLLQLVSIWQVALVVWALTVSSMGVSSVPTCFCLTYPWHRQGYAWGLWDRRINVFVLSMLPLKIISLVLGPVGYRSMFEPMANTFYPCANESIGFCTPYFPLLMIP